MNHQDGKLSRRRLLAFLPLSSIAALVCAVAARSTATQIGPEQKDPGARFYNIADFGAIGDGATVNTVAIQKAIDTCAHENGGTVLVPAGEFVTGTIELKSNITHGAKFFTGRGDMTGPGQNSSAGYYQRPHLLVFYRCQNLSMRDVFLTASAYHCVRLLQCQHLVLDGVRIHNRVNLNNDGFHINSSQYVHISNCDVACQDDACALFGSNKFVTVTNCTFSTRWSVFRFGGGEAENITISNCVIYDTYGCPIKARFGARSRFENVSFSNLVMSNVTGPISLGLDSTRRNANADTKPAPRGVIRNIKFNGIRAVVVAEGKQHDDLPWPQKFRPGEARQCIVLNGVGEDFLENISFQDVHVTYEGGGTAAEAHREVPKLAGEYFEIGTPPAYAIYARNVRGLSLNNVRFEVQTPDLRPALIFENVSDAAVSALSAESDSKAESLLRFTNVRETLLSACRMLTAGPAFLHLIGPDNASIKIDGGDMSKAAKLVTFSGGATAKAVKLKTEER